MSTEIYRMAVEQWGHDRQIDMAIEECAELIVALTHYRRSKADNHDVTQEIADVEIVCGQLRHIFGDEIADIDKRAKLRRLAAKVRRVQGRS